MNWLLIAANSVQNCWVHSFKKHWYVQFIIYCWEKSLNWCLDKLESYHVIDVETLNLSCTSEVNRTADWSIQPCVKQFPAARYGFTIMKMMEKTLCSLPPLQPGICNQMWTSRNQSMEPLRLQDMICIEVSTLWVIQGFCWRWRRA